mmetsp:Transcript_9686/g.19028  ORF Transcript_9686/g.19028 Transcript_9686/m.19028 type:complete len:231 (+) Transcript_9686:589-1281(+)
MLLPASSLRARSEEGLAQRNLAAIMQKLAAVSVGAGALANKVRTRFALVLAAAGSLLGASLGPGLVGLPLLLGGFAGLLLRKLAFRGFGVQRPSLRQRFRNVAARCQVLPCPLQGFLHVVFGVAAAALCRPFLLFLCGGGGGGGRPCQGRRMRKDTRGPLISTTAVILALASVVVHNLSCSAGKDGCASVFARCLCLCLRRRRWERCPRPARLRPNQFEAVSRAVVHTSI